MLDRQHGGGRQERRLLAVHHRLERGAHRHFGLAVAHVAAQQAIHRRGRFHVALDVGDGGGLVGRGVVLEGVFELPLPMAVGAERVAGHRLARGVELEQLFGHVAHGFADPALRALPRRAAQLVERRLAGAAVFLDQVEPLDGHEELVVAGVAELHELLRGVAHANLLQPDELADAVIDMDDVVAHFEIAKVREKGLGDRAMAVAAPLHLRALFLEDVRLGDDLQLRGGQPEAFGELADGDEDRHVEQLVGAIHEHAAQVVFRQQLHRALRAAFRGGDEEDGVAALARAPHLRDPFLNSSAKLHGRLTGDVECRATRSALPAEARATSELRRSPAAPVSSRFRTAAPGRPTSRTALPGAGAVLSSACASS